MPFGGLLDALIREGLADVPQGRRGKRWGWLLTMRAVRRCGLIRAKKVFVVRRRQGFLDELADQLVTVSCPNVDPVTVEVRR